MKNSNDIANRTRDLPDCSAVSRPTAPPQYQLKRSRGLGRGAGGGGVELVTLLHTLATLRMRRDTPPIPTVSLWRTQ
jgi:hypothetical protein